MIMLNKIKTIFSKINFFFFMFMLFNQFLLEKEDPYIYNKDVQERIFNLEIEGITQFRKFLNLFHYCLKDIKSYSSNNDDKNYVCYYNIVTQNFEFYDYKEFNNCLYCCYVNKYLFSEIIVENVLYKSVSTFIRLIYSKYNYPFFKGSFCLYDLESFFFRSLRKLQNNSNVNEFRLDCFINLVEQDQKFFDPIITTEKYTSFFLELLEALSNSNHVIFLDSNTFKFKELRDLDFLLSKSFQTINFGLGDYGAVYCTNFYIDLIDLEDIAKKYSLFSKEEKYKSDDFIFFLLLKSTTNYITYYDFTNNLFYEEINGQNTKHIK